MKRIIRNKLAMYNAVQRVMEQKRSIWQDHAGYSANVEQFNQQYNALLNLSKEVASPITQVTSEKHLNLGAMADKAIVLQGLLSSLAINNDDQELAKKVAMTESAFRRGAVMNRIINTRLLLDIAEEHIEALGGIGWTTEDQSGFTELIDQAEDQLSAPKAEISNRSVKRESMEDLVKKIDTLLDTMDKLMLVFKDEDVEFGRLWKRARNIHDYRPPTANNQEELISEADETEEIDPDSAPPPGGEEDEDEPFDS